MDAFGAYDYAEASPRARLRKQIYLLAQMREAPGNTPDEVARLNALMGTMQRRLDIMEFYGGLERPAASRGAPAC